MKLRPIYQASSLLWLLVIAMHARHAPAAESTTPAPRLHVGPHHRYLVRGDGRPFFYLGDTAWQLFHRLNREEANFYLADRAAKGFTVIQAVALAELDGLKTPNSYGHRPFIELDPTRPAVTPGPANDYWDHVDYIVDTAAGLGLYVGLLPSWGDKWQPGGGAGPVIFNPQNAEIYAEWLGRRYRDKPIIWILGGDRNIYTDRDRSVIAAMARGLQRGDGGNHLITYHPRGPGFSSDFFHDADWLDFNMFQSSHAARDHDNGLFTRHDYALMPPKPTLDGEPRYETIQVGFYNRNVPRNVRFDAYDVRQAAYWSLLAGACGHTYGNNNIWQMWDHGRSPVLGADTPWPAALDHPGAFQMGYVRRLFESRPFLRLEPNDAIVVDGPTRGGAKIRGAMARDGSFAFIYSPRGETFSVNLGAFPGPQVRAAWFDPRYGTSNEIHTGDNQGLQTFVPPTWGRGQDWILILDNADQNFPLPGPG